jgi:predicted metal-dependent peptidase
LPAEVYTHRGTRAIQRLVEYAPGTGGLALWIRHLDDDAIKADLEAATDGDTIYYGPSFDRLSLARQTGVVAHQVLHVALRHPQRSLALKAVVGDVDDELFNACADAIVNSALDHLGWLELPSNAIRLEQILTRVLGIDQPVEKSLLEWDLERLYRAIDDRRRRGSNGRDGHRRPGQGHGEQRRSPNPSAGEGETDEQRQGSGGEHDGARARAVRALAAASQKDLLPASGANPEAEAEQAREWRERLLRAHAGDGPHSMLRELLADLPSVRTPWESLLRTWLTRGLRPTPAPSWSRPARSWLANGGRSASGKRLPWEPGRTSTRAVSRLAVMVDVSGSIDGPMLDRFTREIASISRRTECVVTVLIGDDQVRHVEHFLPGRCELGALTVEGGGGTDFSPLLAEAERLGSDIGVVLTDLDGPASYRPAFPVIWAVPVACAEFREPFGRRLTLE